MTIKGDKLYSFKLFGYSFLIWKKKMEINHPNAGGIGPKGCCKLVRHNDHIVVATSSGEVLPYQTDLNVNAPMDDVATATVTLFISID